MVQAACLYWQSFGLCSPSVLPSLDDGKAEVMGKIWVILHYFTINEVSAWLGFEYWAHSLLALHPALWPLSHRLLSRPRCTWLYSCSSLIVSKLLIHELISIIFPSFRLLPISGTAFIMSIFPPSYGLHFQRQYQDFFPSSLCVNSLYSSNAVPSLVRSGGFTGPFLWFSR